MYTVEQLAAAIKKKHPEYEEVDNESLVNQIVKKYPQYEEVLVKSPKTKTQADNELKKSLFSRMFTDDIPTMQEINKAPALSRAGAATGAALATIVNTPKSAFNVVKEVGSAIIHPKRTVKSLLSLGKGLVQKLTPGKQKDEETVDAVVDIFKERYGGMNNIVKTVTKDPAGFLVDVASVLSGGAAAAGKIGKVSKIGAITEVGKNLKNVSRLIEPLNATGNAIKSAGKMLPDGSVSRFAERLTASSLKLTPSQVQKIEKANLAGVKPEKWLLDRGIIGSSEKIMSQLDDIAKQSKSLVDESLSSVAKTYQHTPTKQALGVLLDTFKNTVGNDDIINTLKTLNAKQQMTLSEINQVKRLIDGELTLFRTTGDLKSGATGRGLGKIRNEIKTFIETEATNAGVANIKQLNKDTQVAVEISNALKATASRRGSNKLLGITDLIAGSAGGVLIGDMGATAGVIIGKKILESPKFKTTIAKHLKSLAGDELVVLESALNAGQHTKKSANIFREVINKVKKDLNTSDIKLTAIQAERLSQELED